MSYPSICMIEPIVYMVAIAVVPTVLFLCLTRSLSWMQTNGTLLTNIKKNSSEDEEYREITWSEAVGYWKK